ncbi:MAG: hypothetical protein AVDCRST_MAG28-3201 [uncultured Rubrobacteraceae bacterium]|uniref:Uncharacterized protein n=1 Tax=uncultured Rubrobacteraceae bacterium TaxID=349277 RepID=A0A6J4RAS2_9ACTN|nr:MAG: hypothetical protein AVDCRST_MAG28-3201 [uncultured Rubrobacteraceae bacterium]
MIIVERMAEHYEVEELEDIGRTYKWRPAQLVAMCRGCGRRATFEESYLLVSVVKCDRCGERSSVEIKERMADEEAHPWRYWRPKEGAGIPF